LLAADHAASGVAADFGAKPADPYPTRDYDCLSVMDAADFADAAQTLRLAECLAEFPVDLIS
jgi:hypothetical protein